MGIRRHMSYHTTAGSAPSKHTEPRHIRHDHHDDHKPDQDLVPALFTDPKIRGVTIVAVLGPADPAGFLVCIVRVVIAARHTSFVRCEMVKMCRIRLIFYHLCKAGCVRIRSPMRRKTRSCASVVAATSRSIERVRISPSQHPGGSSADGTFARRSPHSVKTRTVSVSPIRSMTAFMVRDPFT